MTYDMDVKRIAVFVFSGFLFAQAVDRHVAVARLSVSLRELDRSSDSYRDRVNQEVWSLTEQSHQPTMYSVAAFTTRLIHALAGKNVPAAQAGAIATEIDTVLHSAGLGTWKFKEAISGLKSALQSLGVSGADIDKVTTALESVGKEIRGPEGIPARRVN